MHIYLCVVQGTGLQAILHQCVRMDVLAISLIRTMLKFFCLKHGDPVFFLFEINLNVLVLSGSFEYLCCGFAAIINILILSLRGSSLYVSI